MIIMSLVKVVNKIIENIYEIFFYVYERFRYLDIKFIQN